MALLLLIAARAAADPTVSVNIAPLVVTKPFTVEVAPHRIHVIGTVAPRTSAGEELGSFALLFELLAADGRVLDSSEVKWSQGWPLTIQADVGPPISYSFDDVARVRVSRMMVDTASSRADTKARWETSIRAKGWPPAFTQSVLDGKVAIGMTTDQVLAAWGKPRSINETITSRGKSEQWVYGTGQYLYFDNGVLKTIQQSR